MIKRVALKKRSKTMKDMQADDTCGDESKVVMYVNDGATGKGEIVEKQVTSK